MKVKQSMLKTLARRAKDINTKRIKSGINLWREIFRLTKATAFEHIRKSTSKYPTPLTLTKSSQDANMLVLKELGYVPKATKKKQTITRNIPRNIPVDGWTCRERRLILHAQRKLQNAT